MFCRAGVLFPRKKEKAPDPISYGTEDFRGATHVAGVNRPLLCAVRGAPLGSSPQAPKVEKRFCPAGFHQPPALSEGAAAASFFMAYMGIVYPIFLHSATKKARLSPRFFYAGGVAPLPFLSLPGQTQPAWFDCPARERNMGPASRWFFASPLCIGQQLNALFRSPHHGVIHLLIIRHTMSPLSAKSIT